MENNAKHGYNGEVMMDGVRVARVSKWTIDNKADRAKVSAFGDAHHKYVQGRRDMQGTIEGFLDLSSSSPSDGNAAFFAACKNGTIVVLKLMPDVDDTADYLSGGAVLDCKIEVAESDAIKFSGTWAASGEQDWAGAGLMSGF
jgi:hypothetical protein